MEIKAPPIDIDTPIPFEIKPQIIAVDCDGTLTTSIAWTEEEMRNAISRTEVIEKVNELYERNFVVIHTARRHAFYEVTIDWLKRNNVRYHSIRMGKLPADLYIDDKCINVEDFIDG